MGHIHERMDFTASAWIVFDNKILFHKHRTSGLWLPPGGHIELGEDPNEAAIREAKEETGLDIELVGEVMSYGETPFGAHDLVPPFYLNRHYTDLGRSHEHVDLGFLARPVSDVSLAKSEGDIDTLRWFTDGEIESGAYDIVSDVRAYALVALKELRT